MTDVCFSNHLMPVETAIETMLNHIETITETTCVSLAESHKRVLAQDILSPINVPQHDNSAMDGYGLCVDTQNNPDARQFNLVGRVFAGEIFPQALQAGECVRIMTGAVIPKGVNCVVMQEHVSKTDNRINLTASPKLHDNIRQAGSDIKVNSLVLAKGRVLSAIDIGLIASIGLANVPVFRQIKVGLFSTGDELISPEETLTAGKIYDSNRFMLAAKLAELNVELVDLGKIPDDKTKIKQALTQLSETCDAIVTSGGVSVGDADFTKQVLDELGQIKFWKIAMKPGKPFAFGRIGNCIFFGLPGNPVSAAVTFEQIAQIGLEKLSGATILNPVNIELPLKHPLKKKVGRTDFQRGKINFNKGLAVSVESSGVQNSGVLSTLANANCYIVLDADSGDVSASDTVKVRLF